MTTSVDRWLQTFMCQKYVDVFESWGYKTLQSVCRLEVEHLRSMGVLPEDCEKIMENVTILRQSLSAQCQSPPARFPDPMANPASSALMSMSRSASQRGLSMEIPPPVEQFQPPNVPGYPPMPPGANYEEFHPRFGGPDPSRFPYPQRPPGPWDQGQMGYPPQRHFMGQPPVRGKGWPRMPGAGGAMGPMYGPPGVPGPPGIYRGFRPPQDPQQVADDIVNMTSQRYSQPRQNSSSSSVPSSKPSEPQKTSSQPSPHFASPPGQMSGVGQPQSLPPPPAPSQPSNMRRYRLGSPQNSSSAASAIRNQPPAMSATGPSMMSQCMTPSRIPGEVSPSSGFPPGPYGHDGASPMSPHSMASPGSVYSSNSGMFNPQHHPPYPGTSPVLSGGGMMSPPMMRSMTPTSRSAPPMMQQEFTPHIPCISEESEMMSSRESPGLSKASPSPNLSSCSFSASTSSVQSHTAFANINNVQSQTSTHSGFGNNDSRGTSANKNQAGRKGDPLQSLHKLAMFTNSQVVDPKSVVHDACFSGTGGAGAPMEEGMEKFQNDVGQSKNGGIGSSVVNMAELPQSGSSNMLESVGSRKLTHPNLGNESHRHYTSTEKSSHVSAANSPEVVDFNSKFMASPKLEEDAIVNSDQIRSGDSESGHLDGADADVKMDLDLLLPDDLPAFSNSLEQNLGKKGGELDLWGSDKIDEKWDLFNIPDLYTSNLVDNPEKEEDSLQVPSTEDAKTLKNDSSKIDASPSKKETLKNIAQENPLISDLLSDSGDQESTRSRSCSPQKRAPKEKKKPAKTKAKKAKMKSDEETSVPDPPMHGPPVMRPPPEYPYGGTNPYLPTYGGYYHPQQPMQGHQPPNNQSHNTPPSRDPSAMYGYNHPQQQGYTQCLSTPVKTDCPSNSVSDASPASTDMSPASSITATSPLSQQARNALEARKRRRVRNFVTPRTGVKNESLSSPTGNSLDAPFQELNSKFAGKDDNNKDLGLKARDSSNSLRRSRDLECFPQRSTEKLCGENGEITKLMEGGHVVTNMAKADQGGGPRARVENNNSISYTGINQTNATTMVSRGNDCERQPPNTPIEQSPFLCLGGSNKEPPDKDKKFHRENNEVTETQRDSHSSSSNRGEQTNSNTSKIPGDQIKRTVDQQKTAPRFVEKTKQNDSRETDGRWNNESLSSGYSVISYPLVSCPPVHKSLHTTAVTNPLPRVSIPIGAISASHGIADMASLAVVPDINGNLEVLKGVPSVLCPETQYQSKYLESEVNSQSRYLDSDGICLETATRNNILTEAARTVSVNKNLLKGCSHSQGQSLVSQRLQERLTALELLRLLSLLQNRLYTMDSISNVFKHSCDDGVQDANGNFCTIDRNVGRLDNHGLVEQILKHVQSQEKVNNNTSCKSRLSVSEKTQTNVNKQHSKMKKSLCENNINCYDRMGTCKLAFSKTRMFREISRLTDRELNEINDCLSEFKSQKLNDNSITYFHRKGIFVPGCFSLKDLYRDFSFINANINITAMPVVETDNLPCVVQVAGNSEPDDSCGTNDKTTSCDTTEDASNDQPNSKTNGRVYTSTLDRVPNSTNSVSSSPTKSLKATSPVHDGSPRRQSLRYRQSLTRHTENGFDSPEKNSSSNHSTPVKVGNDGRTVDTIDMGCEDDGSLITITLNDCSNSGQDSESSRDAAAPLEMCTDVRNEEKGAESPHFSMESIQEMSKQVDIPIEIPLEIISIVKSDKMGSPTAVDIKTFNASLCENEKNVFDGDLELDSIKTEADEQKDVEEMTNLEPAETSQTKAEEVKQEQEVAECSESAKARSKKRSQKRKRKSEAWEEDSNDEASFKKLNLSKTFDLFKSGKIKKPTFDKPVKGKNIKKMKKSKEKVKTEPDKIQVVGPFVRVKGPRDIPTDCRVINITDQDLDGKGRINRESANVPQVSYDLNDCVPFLCSLCGHPSSYEGLGDLFGPYYPEATKQGLEAKAKRKKQESHKSPKKVPDIGSPKSSHTGKNKKEKSPERPKRNKKKSLDSMEWEYESRKKMDKKKESSDTPKIKAATTPSQKGKSTPKSTGKKTKASIETVVIDLTGDEPSGKSKKVSSTKSPKVVSTKKAKKSTGSCSSTPKNTTTPQGKKGQQSSAKSSSKKKTPGPQDKDTPAKSDRKGSARKKMERTGVHLSGSDEDGSLKELWFHEDCLIWTSGVYIAGGHIHGVEEAVIHSRNTFCSRCKKIGATLGCFNKGCGQTFHFLCAREASCYFDEETFSVYCSKHKGKKIKNSVVS